MKKIPDTVLPQTYLYDIPTEAGQEVTLVRSDSSVEEVWAGEDAEESDCYNILGQKVRKDYPGLVIQKGSKRLNR